jgi:hypothetical protein
VDLWGTGVLAAEDNKKAASRPGKSAPTAKAGTRQRNASTREGSVGSALRSAYQQTVNEEVPQEFLDLLGRLT